MKTCAASLSWETPRFAAWLGGSIPLRRLERCVMGNPIGYTYDEYLVEHPSAHILGPDHCFTFTNGDERLYEDGGWPRPSPGFVVVGIILTHRTTDGRACAGYCSFVERKPETVSVPDAPHPVWEVEYFDPLTISPSVLCNGKYDCGGTHGFIRNGKWESA